MRYLCLLSVLAACGPSQSKPADPTNPTTPTSPATPSPTAAPAANAPLHAAFGDTLAAAREHDFFMFFGWQETTRSSRDGATAVEFGQSDQSMFKDDVWLEVTVDDADHIMAASLRISRAFIDGPNGMFARDLANSFLRGATPAAAEAELDSLASEIHTRDLGGVVVGAPPPELPPQASDGYLTFAGQQDSYVQEVSGATLRLERIARKDGNWLVLDVASR